MSAPLPKGATWYLQGRDDGHMDAIAAWSSLRWKRPDRELPVLHAERKAYLSGYASALAEYNRTIAV